MSCTYPCQDDEAAAEKSPQDRIAGDGLGEIYFGSSPHKNRESKQRISYATEKHKSNAFLLRKQVLHRRHRRDGAALPLHHIPTQKLVGWGSTSLNTELCYRCVRDFWGTGSRMTMKQNDLTTFVAVISLIPVTNLPSHTVVFVLLWSVHILIKMLRLLLGTLRGILHFVFLSWWTSCKLMWLWTVFSTDLYLASGFIPEHLQLLRKGLEFFTDANISGTEKWL